eukprot:5925400-Prymnesium_polylepis.2
MVGAWISSGCHRVSARAVPSHLITAPAAPSRCRHALTAHARFALFLRRSDPSVAPPRARPPLSLIWLTFP